MTIALVDLSGIFWRHWHSSKSGPQAYESTLEQLTNLVEKYPRMVICCEGKHPVRYEWFPDYKANRAEKEEEAKESLRKIIEELEESPPVKVVCVDRFEGDDLIATLATQATEPVVILSADKDLAQLLTDTVSRLRYDQMCGPDWCVEKFGVRPEQMRDYLAIVGDSADNIPGCTGIGAKGAAALLQRFPTIAAAQQATDEELGLKPAALKKFRAWNPALAIKLTTLLYDAPVNIHELFPPQESETQMADMTKIVTDRKSGPLKVVLYGPEGTGKTRFAAFSTKPIFLCSENGLTAPDLQGVPSFPAIDKWADVFSAVDYLKTAEHGFRTLAIDSLDWLQQHVKAHVMDTKGMSSAQYEDYGRGEKFAIDEWAKLTVALDDLQSAKGMHVIVIAHTSTETFQNPQGDDFARYQLSLTKKAAARWKEWPDFLLFMSQEIFTNKTQGDKGPKGIIGGHRLYTTRSAAFDAKNRINLPTEIEYETANPFRPFALAVKTAMNVGKPQAPEQPAAASA